MAVQSGKKPKTDQQQTPILHRRLHDLRRIAIKLKKSRMTPLQVCEAIVEKRLVQPEIRSFFSDLPKDERHYWIASLYSLLMPKRQRRRLAAYFTPPHLAQHTIDVLIEAGIKPGQDRILDPSSGGAAFLVPLAAQIAVSGRQKRLQSKSILQSINNTLRGVEIDPGLAALSQVLLKDLLNDEIKTSPVKLKNLVAQADTLKLDCPHPLYDAVIGNPPYGRILRPSQSLLERYNPVITDGYVNLYALFIEQSIQWVRPGGIVCLIVPTSFIGGPYFASLRKRILETASVLRLDLIDKRSDVFLDVLYDLCVIVLRRSDGKKFPMTAKTSLLLIDQPSLNLGTLELPATPENHIWALPDQEESGALFQPGLSTLSDYGYIAKTGYFVWNREQHRYRIGKKPRKSEVPLYWAHNVRANKNCTPQDGDKNKIGFVTIDQSSSAIIRSDAIILQRTSNRRQKRRLIGGTIRRSKVIGDQGYVTENHTIVIVPDPLKRQRFPISLLCRLLNTSAVDARFRRMSGSVSVSTKALRELPLPNPQDVREFFSKQHADDEVAAVAAYASSVARFIKSEQKSIAKRSS